MKIIKPLLSFLIKITLAFISLFLHQVTILAQEKYSLDSLVKLSFEELMNIPITTASKHEQKISETPASVYVFTRQDIEENGYQYLSDILRYIPNMEVHWSGGPQYVVTAELRGMNQFIFLMDGIRIDPASSVSPQFGFVYPLNNVKKVEVLMGPSSALYGADASAGIINIITLDPEEENTESKVEVFAGNHEYIGSQILLQQASDRMNAQLSLSYIHFNDNDKTWWKYLNDAYSGYPAGISKNYETNYENPLQSFSSSGKVKFGNTTLGFNFWARDVAGGLRLDPMIYNANRNTKTSTYEYLSYIQNKFVINQKLTLLSHLSTNYYLTRYNFYYIKRNLDDPKHYRESADRIYWLEEFDYQVTDNTRILAGLEAQTIISVPKEYNAITNEQGKEIGFGEPISDNDALTYYQIRSASMFLQMENIYFNNRIKTNIGIRSDRYSTFGWTTNPRASAYFKLANPLSIRLMYGRAFFTPPPDKMFRTSYVPGSRYQTSNKDLRPRTNANFEIAIDYHPSSWLSMEARVFRNKVKDEIVFMNTKKPYISGSDTVNIYQHQNVGFARYEGAEFLLRSILPHNFKFQTGISYLTGYTQTDAESDKEALTSNSEFKVTWNLSKRISKNININLQGLHLINRMAYEGNFIYPDGKMPDVFNLNLNMQAENIWKSMGCNLKIVNLMDNKWSDIPGISSSASPEFPQERRRIMFGIDWRF